MNILTDLSDELKCAECEHEIMSLFNLQDMRYSTGRGGICYLKQEIGMVIYHHFQSNQI